MFKTMLKSGREEVKYKGVSDSFQVMTLHRTGLTGRKGHGKAGDRDQGRQDSLPVFCHVLVQNWEPLR